LVKNLSKTASGQIVSEETARKICEVIGIPANPAKTAEVKEILSYNYHLPDADLKAENNYFFARTRLGDAHGQAARLEVPMGASINGEMRYRIADHYFSDHLPLDASISRNVRVTNLGPAALSSAGTTPVHLAYHWRDSDGQLIEWEGVRSRLPIDLVAGRTMTVPMLVRTPRVEGTYMLELTLVHEQVHWLDGDARRITVRVSCNGSDPVPEDWVQTGKQYDYRSDHVLGQEMLQEEFGNGGGMRRKVLEIGGCCHPQAERLSADVYNVDIDVQTLQIGHLRPRNMPGQVRFICADANQLPFVDASVDAIVMFSTFHHFAQPTRLLTGLKRLLKHDGFIALLSEPVGHYLDAERFPDYLNDLKHGINEQSFSLEEYDLMFRRAELRASRVVVDEGSFKGILRV
jgi:SAM-dependent methyltransferase